MTVRSHQLVVVGAGSAGLTVAFGAASAGIDTALIERGPIGGDCTWRGCVPSKTLIDTARRVHQAKRSRHLGVTTHRVEVDFGAVMAHVHEVSAAISADEGEDVLSDAGVTVYRSTARFRDESTLVLEDGASVRGKRIVLATGATPRVPGQLHNVAHLTTDTVWGLTELPERLAVVGGGAVGCELAQAFRRLGSDVTIITDVVRLLPDAHPDASAIVTSELRREGVEMDFGRTVASAVPTAAGPRLALDDGSIVDATHVLVAIGKEVRLDELDAAAAGIDLDQGRPILDAQLRTSRSHIFVCGDAAGAGLTHVASRQAAGVLLNLVSPRPLAVDPGVRRWAVFTDPEVAQVGMTEAEALDQGLSTRVTRLPIGRADRARIQDGTTGFVEAVHSRTGKLHGVTIVGPGAAELANQWVPHVGRRARITDLVFTDTIYPTLGTVNALVAFEWAQHVARDTIAGKVARLAGRFRLALARRPGIFVSRLTSHVSRPPAGDRLYRGRSTRRTDRWQSRSSESSAAARWGAASPRWPPGPAARS